MKVLHVAETLPGGIAAYLNDVICFQLNQCKTDGGVFVLGPEEQGVSMSSRFREHFIGYRRNGRGLASLYRLGNALNKLISCLKPDVVHAHSTFAGLVVRLMRPLFGSQTKIVYCPHGWSFDRRDFRLLCYFYMLLERALSHFCDAIVCISEADYASALRCGIDRAKLILVVNGIEDLRALPEVPADVFDKNDPRRRLLFVGRFDRQKGHDLFIDAVARESGSVCGVMVGDFVTDGAWRVPLPDNIRQIGWQPKDRVVACMRESDVIIVPSRWEGFGLVAIEAFCLSKPVICSKVGGLREIVQDGVTGFFLDDVSSDSLVVAIRRFLSAGDVSAMGRLARNEYLRRFTSERMNLQLLRLYSDLVNV